MCASLQRDPGSSAAGATKTATAGRDPVEIRNDFQEMAESARVMGFDVAAANLDHFLYGKGALRTLDPDWVRSFGAVLDGEKRIRRYFASGPDENRDQSRWLEKVAVALPITGGSDELADHWFADIRAGGGTELFYASGSSKLRADGRFDLQRVGSTVEVRGTVDFRWFDRYDWNPGGVAFIPVPGGGLFRDDDGRALEAAGMATSYWLESRWTSRVGGTIDVASARPRSDLSWD